MVHAEIDDAQADAIALPHDHRRGGGCGDAIEGQPVEFHIRGIRDIQVRQDGPFLKDDSEVMVRMRWYGFSGWIMNIPIKPIISCMAEWE